MKLRVLCASIFVLLAIGSVPVRAQQTINADFDSSGAVDFADFSRLVSQFGLVSDSTRFQPAVDLNQDNAIDGADAFLFADVFGNDRSAGNLTVSTGPHTNASLSLDPTDQGFLVYLNNVSSIGGYRIVLSMPDSVDVRSVEDHLGIGLLPIRRTRSGVEIVGLVLGNRNLDVSGLIAGLSFTRDTTGVSVQSVSLRGKRINLGNQLYRGDRNTLVSTNIKRVPIGDVAIRPRIFDLGEVILGQTRTRSFDISNTFNNQQALGAQRKLAFEITSSKPELVVDPHIFGVLSDTSTGLVAAGSQKVALTFTPTQTGVFQGILAVKTNRSERSVVHVHVKADVRSSSSSSRVRAVANFDTLKFVGYDDFQPLITNFGKIPDSTKYDLDKDGVVDGDDAFLFADLLGGFQGRASYDTVRVIPGANSSSAVRVQSVGEEMTVSVRDLSRLGGYRLNLSYDPNAVDVRWAKDLAGGGIMPVHKTSTGAHVVGIGFGALLETPTDLPLARISIKPLNGQANAASLVRVSSVIFRGHKGERDSVGAVHIGGNGLDASPRVLDFGPLRIGATAQKTFRVYNLNAASTAFQIVSSDSLVKTSPRSVGNLGGGRTWDVTVTYQSAAQGPFASTLKLSASDTDTSAITIAVKAFGTVVNVAPDSLVFADTFVGQNATQLVTLTNPDLTPFEVTDLRFQSTDTTFVIDTQPTLPLSVAGEGGKAVFRVRFNPQVQGGVLDTLAVIGQDTTFKIPLRGRGLRRQAVLSPLALDFGQVDVGRDSTLSVVIRNTGNVTYRVDSLRVVRKDTSFALVGTTTFPDTLAIAGADSFQVRFRPDTTGVKSDTLKVYGQDTIWSVGLAGTGLPRQIVEPPPLEDVVIVTFGGSINKSRNEIHFGKVPWGVSDTAKVRVQNKRSGNLTFRFSTTDSQVVVKPDSVQNLPPNQEWDVLLTLTPKTSVQTTSELRITTNDVGDGVTSVVLKSGGSNPVLSDSVLSFSKLGIGNRLDKLITLTNTGNSRLVLDSLALGPDSNFALVNPPTLPVGLAANGGKQAITVRFQPKTRGTLTNSLRFSGLDTSITLPLVGIGRESKLTFAPDSLGFGLLRVGKRDTVALSISNDGGDTVVVNSLQLLSTVGAFALAQTPVVPDTLIPGANRRVSVVFAPQAAGTQRDTLRIIAGLDTLQANVSGTGTVAIATISSLTRNLGALAVGRSLLDTVAVTNIGNVSMAIRDVTLRQGTKGFALLQSPQDTLGANKTFSYVVRLQPDTTGTLVDTLQIHMVDTTFSVAYHVTGTPTLTLTRTASGIQFTPEKLDFGNLADGQLGRRIIRVTNAATTPWSFTTQVDAPGLNVSPSSFAGLPGTQSWELVARWTPGEKGPKLTTLKVTTDSVLTIPVGRNGAFVRLLTDSLGFGSLRLNQDSTQVIRLRNVGQGRVSINSVGLTSLAGFDLVSLPTLPVVLTENDSMLVRVKFNPKSAGAALDTVRVVAADTVFAVPVRGVGIQSVIALDKEALAFGNVTANTDASQSVVIQNTGNGSFVLDSLKLVTGTSAFLLTSTPTTPSTILGGGDADTVTVRFLPPDLGDYSGTLLLYGGTQTWTVPITGKSLQTGPVSTGVVLSFGPSVTKTDSVINFGNVPFASTRKLSFTVTNTRDSLLTFSVLSNDGQVTVESLSTTSLLPNQSATVNLAFTPVVGGATAFDLNISTNAPSDGTVNLRVIKDRPPVSVSPLSLDFGAVVVGNSDTLKTVILNPQVLNFTVSELKLKQGQPFSLFEPNPLPDTVRANGGTRVVTVRFAPSGSGTFSDTLQIVGSSKRFDVALVGKGLLAQVSSDVDSLKFGLVDVGKDSILSFTVSNTGEAALVVGKSIVEGTQFALTDTADIPDTLGIGNTHIFKVRYSPTAGGTHVGGVRIPLGGQTVRVALSGSGLAPPRVAAGPFALDMDLANGDQGVRELTVSGRTVAVELAVTESASGTSGFNVRLGFDAALIGYDDFSVQGLYDGATVLVDNSVAGQVDISVVFLGTQTASVDSGSAGHATFNILGDGSASNIRIVQASFAKAGVPVSVEIGSAGAQVTVQGSAEPTADFNGDGEVGFADFILFASAFGTRLGEAGFDGKFDLSGNGVVDFPDFIAFAGKFGTKTGKPVLSKPTAK